MPDDGRIGDGPAGVPQGEEGLDGGNAVGDLVAAHQRQVQREPPVAEVGAGEGHLPHPDGGEVPQDEAAVQGGGALHDGGQGLVLLGGVGDHRHAPAQDTALFPGDGGGGIPEELGVVEADGADHRQHRGADQIGGVPPAAEARLEDDDVALAAGIPEEGGGADQLKFGGTAALGGHDLGGGSHLLHHLTEGLRRDHGPVDLDPLPEVENERRDEQPGAVAGGGEAAGDHRAGAALAVGADDMDEPEDVLGVAEAVHQLGDALQAPFFPPAPGAVDIGDGFAAGHRGSLPFAFV